MQLQEVAAISILLGNTVGKYFQILPLILRTSICIFLLCLGDFLSRHVTVIKSTVQLIPAQRESVVLSDDRIIYSVLAAYRHKGVLLHSSSIYCIRQASLSI